MCMSTSIKAILTSYFLEKSENPPIPNLKPPISYNNPQLWNALEHFTSCKNPICDECQVARMLQLGRGREDFKQFKELRRHIRQTCLNSNLSDDYRTKTLQMSQMMYKMFLQNIYTEWTCLRDAGIPESGFPCKICLDCSRNPATFNCGHWVCINCSAKVNECPICRAKILIRIPVFI